MNEKYEKLISAYLNSFVCLFFCELLAPRKALGALELALFQLENLPVPDFDTIQRTLASEIESVFLDISRRKIETVEDEIKKLDRQYLDRCILKCFGLSEYSVKYLLQEIYSTLTTNT